MALNAATVSLLGRAMISDAPSGPVAETAPPTGIAESRASGLPGPEPDVPGPRTVGSSGAGACLQAASAAPASPAAPTASTLRRLTPGRPAERRSALVMTISSSFRRASGAYLDLRRKAPI